MLVILWGLFHSTNVLERVITGFENGVDVLWFKSMMNSSHVVLAPPTYAVITPTVMCWRPIQVANRLHSRQNDFAGIQEQTAQKINNLSQKKRCAILMSVVSGFHCTINIHLFSL